MAIQIQLRQGTTTEHNTFTGAVGEVTVDTTKDVVVVHDGVTAGGHPVATKANADGTISLIKKDGTSAGTINALGLFNNTLTSTNTDQGLTAAQGKILKDLTDTKLATTSALGVGQTWTVLTGSRVIGTTYTNSTGRPIQVCMSVDINNAHFFINGVDMYIPDFDGYGNHYFIVPNGQTYRLEGAGGINSWSELR